MTMMQKFVRMWNYVSFVGVPSAFLQNVINLHVSPDRFYHVWNHVLNMMKEVEDYYEQDAWNKKSEIIFAVLFHDCVYDPRSQVNEEKSAERMEHMLAQVGATKSFIKKVRSLILITKHTNVPTNENEKVIVDADLSILGKPWDEFCVYELAIRKEYEFVPLTEYIQGREAVLRMFLSRERIYATDFFYTKYEAVARENMKRAIELLYL